MYKFCIIAVFSYLARLNVTQSVKSGRIAFPDRQVCLIITPQVLNLLPVILGIEDGHSKRLSSVLKRPKPCFTQRVTYSYS